MSLIGIDVGTSAIKIVVYTEEGKLLTHSRVPIQPIISLPGWEESDPELVWDATFKGLRAIVGRAEVKNDPPCAMAISASGDEVFPIDEKGEAIGHCLLSGDIRGDDIESRTAAYFNPIDWYLKCGHIPERMDPINRLIWWKEHHPEICTRTAGFWGWHEFLTNRLTGNAVTDPTLASKWLVYDFALNDWSDNMLSKFSIDRRLLPKINAWGIPLGVVKASIANELGFSGDIKVGVGTFDSACSALGSGSTKKGILGLTCGSWEVVVAPHDDLTVTEKLVNCCMSIVPYAGKIPYALLAQSPNGARVADWTTKLLNLPFEAVRDKLAASGLHPSPIIAVPHLSGALSPWKNGRDSRGALLGMTLATTQIDVVKAFLESVAFDLAITIDILQNVGVSVDVIRASGGGTKSAWEMQLKADLTGIPIEVVNEPEPGALGAALLAGMAAGIYNSAHEAYEAFHCTVKRYEPSQKRKEYYAGRLNTYIQTVKTLNSLKQEAIC